MTVQELIDRLNKVKDKNVEVVIRGTDPTDFTYNNEVKGVGFDKIYLTGYDEKKTKIFVIDGGMF
jgi:hypothetical protein